MQELGVDRDTLPGRPFAWGRSGEDDRRTRPTDVRIGIPGQHVRKDRGVPSGFIDREIPHFLLSDLINVPSLAVFEHQRLLFI